MPKDRRSRSLSFERQLRAPYRRHSSTCHKHSSSSSSSSSSRQSTEEALSWEADIKEWEEARCAVCMEHPHNAVLLLCSSYDNGCRPYMCDTSYRHSNCLDQFRKAFTGGDASCPEQDGVEKDQAPKLSCPLCRGEVRSWTVVEPARRYMNAKARICSLESCGYSGAYRELREHARTEHPSVRPSDADPERQRNWRRMERQRDIEDLLSTIRPLFADEDDGAAVVGGGGDVLDGRRRQFFYCVMIIRVHRRRQGEAGAASNPPHPHQVFVTFGSGRGQPTRRRRRRSHTESGEEQDGEEPGDDGDGNIDGDGEE